MIVALAILCAFLALGVVALAVVFARDRADTVHAFEGTIKCVRILDRRLREVERKLAEAGKCP